MKSEVTLHQNFLTAYDMFVGEIFSFFTSRSHHRDDAQHLTHSTFKKTWKDIVRDGQEMHINDIHAQLQLNARKLARISHFVPIHA